MPLRVTPNPKSKKPYDRETASPLQPISRVQAIRQQLASSSCRKSSIPIHMSDRFVMASDDDQRFKVAKL